MKTFLISTLLCAAIALTASGELTDADLDKIRLIVNESEKRIKAEIKEELKPIKADVEALKIDVARLEGRITGIEGRITGIEGRFTGVEGRFSGIEKQIAHATNLTYGLIALIVFAVGLPQAILAWHSGKERSLERQIEKLTQEVDALKQQRIVNPRQT